MLTIADENVLAALVARLGWLRPETPRRWGTLAAGEMLCHLGDAHESVLRIRIPPGPPPSGKPRPVFKWLALNAPIRWPKGAKTRPGVNPHQEGTRPGDFERDRERVIVSLATIRTANPATLAPHHSMFGPMSAPDWYRWGYLHVDHHLRQFGL